MTVNLSMLAGAGAQLLDNNANPLSGGLLYTYEAGTTTPLATYTTSAGNVAHTNPIVLDSAGRVPNSGEIWLTDGDEYKFVVKTAAGVTIATYDNITGNGNGILTTLAASSGSSLIGFIAAGAGAVARTSQAKMRDAVSVKDYGASSSATAAANLAAFKLAVAAVQTGGSLIIPADASFYSIDTTGGLSTAIEIDKRMQIVFEGDVKANFGTQQTNPPYIFHVTANDVTFTGGGGKIIGNGTINDANSGTEAVFPGLIYVSGDNFTMTGCIVDTPPKLGVLLYDCTGAKILGNTFTGGPIAYSDTAYFAIRAYLGQGHDISNNLFTPDANGGMYVNTIFFNGTSNSVIDSNVCVYPYEKLVYCVGDKNTVSNNQVIGNPNTIPGSSPALKGTLTSVYRFDGDYNICVGNYSDFCAAGATCLNSKGNLISGNTFLRNGQLGIVAFETAGYTGSLTGTTITNNIMSFDNTMGFSVGVGGIQVTASESAATDILVTGNFVDTFVNAMGAGINVQGTLATKITKAKISNNHIISSTNGVLMQYVEESVVSENLMNDINNAMVVQLSTCSANYIVNNFSTTAGSVLDNGYSTNSTYCNNQYTTAPLQGVVTLAAANTTVVSHGGVEINAKVFLQPANASAATLVSGAKSPYVVISQPDFVIYTADGTAAAGTEIFWYNIVQ